MSSGLTGFRELMVSRLKDEGSPAAPHKRALLPRRHDQRGSAQLLNLICRQFCDKTREAGDQGSSRALPILIALHPCLRCAVGSASHDGIAFCDAPARLDLIGVLWGRGETHYILTPTRTAFLGMLVAFVSARCWPPGSNARRAGDRGVTMHVSESTSRPRLRGRPRSHSYKPDKLNPKIMYIPCAKAPRKRNRPRGTDPGVTRGRRRGNSSRCDHDEARVNLIPSWCGNKI